MVLILLTMLDPINTCDSTCCGAAMHGHVDQNDERPHIDSDMSNGVTLRWGDPRPTKTIAIDMDWGKMPQNLCKNNGFRRVMEESRIWMKFREGITYMNKGPRASGSSPFDSACLVLYLEYV